MVSTAGEFLDDFAVAVVGGNACEVAVFALNNHPDFLAPVLVHVAASMEGGEAADFKDDHRVTVIVHDELGVGRLAVVLVTEPAADTDDTGRQLVLAESP